MRVLVSFIVGLFFAFGLCVSRMTLPQNILAFLDVRHWSPVLLCVMVGALVVYSIAFGLITRRAKPVLGERFEIPTRRDITRDLVLGSALFGIGWGLGGFCGGPAIVSLVAGRTEVFVFVVAMFLGTFVFQALARRTSPKANKPSQQENGLAKSMERT